MKPWWYLVLLVILGTTTASAHEGKPESLPALWSSWVWEPGIVSPLCFTGWLYCRGLRRFWKHRPGAGIRFSEATYFAGGWLTLVLALVSPLHSWGNVLFAAHMTQHELLMLVAAPLMILGRPLIAFLKAMPLSWAV